MQVYYNKLGSEGSNLPQGIELRKGVEMLRIWAPSYEDETEFLEEKYGFLSFSL